MYPDLIEKDSQSRALTKIGWQVFMFITAKLWQANLTALGSAFWTTKVLFAEFNYDHI
jgi:hypothetical protein